MVYGITFLSQSLPTYKKNMLTISVFELGNTHSQLLLKIPSFSILSVYTILTHDVSIVPQLLNLLVSLCGLLACWYSFLDWNSRFIQKHELSKRAHHGDAILWKYPWTSEPKLKIQHKNHLRVKTGSLMCTPIVCSTCF